LTTIYDQHHDYWGWDLSGTAESSTFEFKADIRFDEEEIIYIPTALVVLRDAWVKYLAMFVIVGFFLERWASFVYFHQIVETKMMVETFGSQTGVPNFKRF